MLIWIIHTYTYRIPDLFWGVYFQFFFLECYGSDNQPLGTEQIYEQLKNIVNQSNEPDIPVGLLTTENRNKWAKAYELLAKGKQGWGDCFQQIHERKEFKTC